MDAGSNHRKLKTLRFGVFQFNPATGELHRSGAGVPLQNTPARLLAELLSRPGELHTREELCAQLWPAGVHLDFENNLNNAVARLRQALGDGSGHLIETVPKRGYRFAGGVIGELPDLTTGTSLAAALRRGRHFRGRTTVRDLWRAVDCFERAIASHPDCGEAHAGLSDVYVLLGDDVLGGIPPSQALPRAEAEARAALAIDPDCPGAYTTLAMVRWRLHWDWRGAEEAFRQSAALDPSNATTFQYYSWLLQGWGRAEEAREAMLHALALDPASPFVSANVGWMLYLGRQYNEAIHQLREAVELDENYALAHLPIGYILQQTGRLDEAIGHFRFALDRGRDSYYQAALGQALAQAGRSREVAAILAEPGAGGISSFNHAMIHASLGREEETLECLERAVTEHSSAVAYLEVDPLFDRLRGHPRYKRIAQQSAEAG